MDIETVLGLILTIFVLPLVVMVIWNVGVAAIVGFTLTYPAALSINLIVFIYGLIYS